MCLVDVAAAWKLHIVTTIVKFILIKFLGLKIATKCRRSKKHIPYMNTIYNICTCMNVYMSCKAWGYREGKCYICVWFWIKEVRELIHAFSLF